ncbi:hypothetical protein MPER_09009 [Moniliophthora perniciosa FA553]|nr:hypothetical protein MPER_09009 [Moniliophthora perniciosa FA553]
MVILKSRFQIADSRDEAKLNRGQMFPGWTQSVDIRFQHSGSRSGQSSRNQVGVESSRSRDQNESERSRLPKVVELNNLDGNNRDPDNEIPSKLLHHRTLQDEE